MKKFFALLFLLTAASLGAQSATLDLGSRGKLTLYLAGDWKIDTTNFANQGSLAISPTREAVNAACTINVTFPERDSFDTKARLKLRVEADSRNMAEQSVERKAVAKEFNVASGYGFYCNFTDPELKGKPPEKGNYKTMSAGKIRLSAEVVLEVSIVSDGFNSDPYQQLLGAIEGMEFSSR